MSTSIVLGAVAACLLSVSAHAADKSRWTEVGNVPAAAFYADYTTAKRKDGYINIWLLINYTGNNKTSHRTLQDIDCGDSRMRVTYRVLSAKPFGEGKVLDTVNTPDAQWQPLVPQSAYARVAEEVCKAVGR